MPIYESKYEVGDEVWFILPHTEETIDDRGFGHLVRRPIVCSGKINKEQEILAEALIASVSNKKILVVCRDNVIKERLLKVAREYGVESAIEIKVPPRDIGKRAEAVIIDDCGEKE